MAPLPGAGAIPGQHTMGAMPGQHTVGATPGPHVMVATEGGAGSQLTGGYGMGPANSRVGGYYAMQPSLHMGDRRAVKPSSTVEVVPSQQRVPTTERPVLHSMPVSQERRMDQGVIRYQSRSSTEDRGSVQGKGETYFTSYASVEVQGGG